MRTYQQLTLEEKPYKIGSWIVLRLAKEESAKLPSRALTMVKGTINGHSFKAAFEPDGKGSHWFRIDVAKAKMNEGKRAIKINLQQILPF